MKINRLGLIAIVWVVSGMVAWLTKDAGALEYAFWFCVFYGIFILVKE